MISARCMSTAEPELTCSRAAPGSRSARGCSRRYPPRTARSLDAESGQFSTVADSPNWTTISISSVSGWGTEHSGTEGSIGGSPRRRGTRLTMRGRVAAWFAASSRPQSRALQVAELKRSLARARVSLRSHRPRFAESRRRVRAETRKVVPSENRPQRWMHRPALPLSSSSRWGSDKRA